MRVTQTAQPSFFGRLRLAWKELLEPLKPWTARGRAEIERARQGRVERGMPPQRPSQGPQAQIGVSRITAETMQNWLKMAPAEWRAKLGAMMPTGDLSLTARQTHERDVNSYMVGLIRRIEQEPDNMDLREQYHAGVKRLRMRGGRDSQIGDYYAGRGTGLPMPAIPPSAPEAVCRLLGERPSEIQRSMALRPEEAGPTFAELRQQYEVRIGQLWPLPRPLAAFFAKEAPGPYGDAPFADFALGMPVRGETTGSFLGRLAAQMIVLSTAVLGGVVAVEGLAGGAAAGATISTGATGARIWGAARAATELGNIPKVGPLLKPLTPLLRWSLPMVGAMQADALMENSAYGQIYRDLKRSDVSEPVALISGAWLVGAEPKVTLGETWGWITGVIPFEKLLQAAVGAVATGRGFVASPGQVIGGGADLRRLGWPMEDPRPLGGRWFGSMADLAKARIEAGEIAPEEAQASMRRAGLWDATLWGAIIAGTSLIGIGETGWMRGLSAKRMVGAFERAIPRGARRGVRAGLERIWAPEASGVWTQGVPVGTVVRPTPEPAWIRESAQAVQRMSRQGLRTGEPALVEGGQLRGMASWRGRTVEEIEQAILKRQPDITPARARGLAEQTAETTARLQPRGVTPPGMEPSEAGYLEGTNINSLIRATAAHLRQQRDRLFPHGVGRPPAAWVEERRSTDPFLYLAERALTGIQSELSPSTRLGRLLLPKFRLGSLVTPGPVQERLRRPWSHLERQLEAVLRRSAEGKRTPAQRIPGAEPFLRTAERIQQRAAEERLRLRQAGEPVPAELNALARAEPGAVAKHIAETSSPEELQEIMQQVRAAGWDDVRRDLRRWFVPGGRVEPAEVAPLSAMEETHARTVRSIETAVEIMGQRYSDEEILAGSDYMAKGAYQMAGLGGASWRHRAEVAHVLGELPNSEAITGAALAARDAQQAAWKQLLRLGPEGRTPEAWATYEQAKRAAATSYEPLLRAAYDSLGGKLPPQTQRAVDFAHEAMTFYRTLDREDQRLKALSVIGLGNERAPSVREAAREGVARLWPAAERPPNAAIAELADAARQRQVTDGQLQALLERAHPAPTGAAARRVPGVPLSEQPPMVGDKFAPTRWAEQFAAPLGGERQPLRVAPAPVAREATVPVMITERMRADLRAAGVTADEIANMTPEQAWQRLRAAVPAERLTPVLDEAGRPMRPAPGQVFATDAQGRTVIVPEEALGAPTAARAPEVPVPPPAVEAGPATAVPGRPTVAQIREVVANVMEAPPTTLRALRTAYGSRSWGYIPVRGAETAPARPLAGARLQRPLQPYQHPQELSWLERIMVDLAQGEGNIETNMLRLMQRRGREQADAMKRWSLEEFERRNGLASGMLRPEQKIVLQKLAASAGWVQLGGVEGYLPLQMRAKLAAGLPAGPIGTRYVSEGAAQVLSRSYKRSLESDMGSILREVGSWWRGPVLMRLGFHAMNVADGIVGSYLAGNPLFAGFGEGLQVHMMKSLMTLRELPSRTAMEEIGLNGRRLVLEALGGDKVRLRALAMELRDQNIIGHGIFEQFLRMRLASGEGPIEARFAAAGWERTAKFLHATLGRAEQLNEWNRAIGTFSDDLFRTMAYINTRRPVRLSSGSWARLSPRGGADLMRAGMVDYGRALEAPFDAVMREFMFFWTWTRQRNEQLIRAGLKHPALPIGLYATQQAWRRGEEAPFSPVEIGPVEEKELFLLKRGPNWTERMFPVQKDSWVGRLPLFRDLFPTAAMEAQYGPMVVMINPRGMVTNQVADIMQWIKAPIQTGKQGLHPLLQAIFLEDSPTLGERAQRGLPVWPTLKTGWGPVIEEARPGFGRGAFAPRWLVKEHRQHTLASPDEPFRLTQANVDRLRIDATRAWLGRLGISTTLMPLADNFNRLSRNEWKEFNSLLLDKYGEPPTIPGDRAWTEIREEYRHRLEREVARLAKEHPDWTQEQIDEATAGMQVPENRARWTTEMARAIRGQGGGEEPPPQDFEAWVASLNLPGGREAGPPRAAFHRPGISVEPHLCGATVSDVLGLPRNMDSATASVSNGYWERNGYRYIGTIADVGEPQPWDVVVMPWMSGDGLGHVGIAEGAGTYYSNYEGKLRSRRIEGPRTLVYRKE